MWLGNIVRAGLLVFLGIHLYAVALRFIPVPTTILMFQRGLSGEDIKREWTRLDNISPYMIEAVMGGEDSRFCEHDGIDWEAIGQALEDNQEGGRRRGGSTITQQAAKNVFFWNGGGYLRKAGEAWFASLIDFTWGKPRVMEVYLNVAEWGDGIFGVEAAAQNRFGKSARNLSQQEAALLAAVLPSPNKWRLNPPTSFVQGRAGTLRQRMAVIRNSNYASCVLKGSAPQPVQREPVEKAPQEMPKEASEEQVVEDNTETAAEDNKANSLEEILDAAEDSLKKDKETMPPKPQQPTEIPPVQVPVTDPATVPTPQPSEIPPTISPEIPRETPQEVPIETPPTEIPQRIDTPRIPPGP